MSAKNAKPKKRVLGSQPKAFRMVWGWRGKRRCRASVLPTEATLALEQGQLLLHPVWGKLTPF